MPSSDAPEVLIARFLSSNGYPETLEAFQKEANLPATAAVVEAGCLTIEQVLLEKKKYEVDLAYQKVSDGDEDGNGGRKGWAWGVSAPSAPRLIDEDIFTSNILDVYVPAQQSRWQTDVGRGRERQRLFVSSADRTISILSVYDGPPYLQARVDLNQSHKSPVLCMTSISTQTLMLSSMSGNVDVLRPGHGGLSRSSNQHAKYAVQVIVTASRAVDQHGTPFCIAASAGWDHKICLYSFEPPREPADDHETDEIREREEERFKRSPLSQTEVRLSAATNPESILFARHPDTDELYMLVGCRDSTHLLYYRIKEGAVSERHHSVDITIEQVGRQNLAPNASSWTSFSLSCLASCPTDPTLVAVATSHEPHMKLIIVRLLFPDFHAVAAAPVTGAATEPSTQASQARVEFANQQREEAAIMTCVLTMAPQTSYSKPQVVWRPDGSGVWVNGDDGVIRGIEAKTGKIISALRGHEAGCKVRTLWAGMITCWKETESGTGEEGEIEWLVSGGFDKKVIVWEAGSSGGEANQ